MDTGSWGQDQCFCSRVGSISLHAAPRCWQHLQHRQQVLPKPFARGVHLNSARNSDFHPRCPQNPQPLQSWEPLLVIVLRAS